MRTADITVGGEYACTPQPPEFHSGERRVERARVVAARRRLVDIAVPTDQGGEVHYKNLPAQHVRRPWAEEQWVRDLAQLKRDAQEADRRVYEASRDAVVRHFAEAFRGLDVGAPGDLATVDLATRLIETFTVRRSVTATCEWDVFEAVARRIFELNELARQNALVAGDDAAAWSA